MIDEKLEHLKRLLAGYESCVVAYSGGVDSVLLAYLSHQVLGDGSLAVIADSPSLPRRELEEALELGERFGFSIRVVHTQEMSNQEYTANPINRCFHCKHELFVHLRPLVESGDFRVIVYGENASDIGDHRPGATAAAQFQVAAPLKEAGLTKSEIRQLSSRFGLPTADKPQLACLSSRIPYGEKVSVEKLGMIEAAENVLRDLGFYDVRVRHHELAGSAGTKLALARIELGAEELAGFGAGGDFEQVDRELRRIGYGLVTLDLQGYRRGSLNAQLPPSEVAGKL